MEKKKPQTRAQLTQVHAEETANLRKQLANARQDEKEARERADRFHEENKFLRAEVAWWSDYGKQAQMFLLGLTNTLTIAGRGWIETKRRLDAERPQASNAQDAAPPERPYALAT